MITFDKEDSLVFEIRKHWLVVVSQLVVLLFFALLPLVLFYLYFDISKIINFFEGNLSSFLIFIYTAWLLFLWVVAFIFWTDYYLDVWIITKKKILDVDQKGLFRREVSFLHLEKIQDITYKIEGFIPTLLNYGDISVKTAGNIGGFEIKRVPNPAFVQAKMNETLIVLREKERRRARKDIRLSMIKSFRDLSGNSSSDSLGNEIA